MLNFEIRVLENDLSKFYGWYVMGSDVLDFSGIVHAKKVLINHYSSEIIGHKQNASNNTTVIVEFHSIVGRAAGVWSQKHNHILQSWGRFSLCPAPCSHTATKSDIRISLHYAS